MFEHFVRQQIDKLKAELEAKRARCASLEKQLEGGGARDTPSSALNETIEFINANSMIEKLTNENVMLKEVYIYIYQQQQCSTSIINLLNIILHL